MKIDALTDIPHHVFLQPSGCSSLFAGALAVQGNSGHPREQHPSGSAQGCRGTRPACTFQGVFALFSLYITSYYHSFATAICPTHQRVFFVSLSSLVSAQHLRQLRWDRAVGSDGGRGSRTSTHLQRWSSQQLWPPVLLLHGLRSSVATREGRGRKAGSDCELWESWSTGCWVAATLAPHC